MRNRYVTLLALPFLFGQATSQKEQRLRMVEDQLVARGIEDERVLEAMRTVRRHEFVPEDQLRWAYSDGALPIGYGQTISQPYVVAFMTEQLDLDSHHKLYELGTGSGYQAAVASLLVAEVYTVEIVPELASRAAATLAASGFANVHVRAGDGWAGWPEAAPFDRMIVTAAAEEIPPPLLDQLADGGKLIMPVGGEHEVQQLKLVEKSATGKISVRSLIPVRFVPVTGEHGAHDDR